jgi:hypothetical protein
MFREKVAEVTTAPWGIVEIDAIGNSRAESLRTWTRPSKEFNSDPGKTSPTKVSLPGGGVP